MIRHLTAILLGLNFLLVSAYAQVPAGKPEAPEPDPVSLSEMIEQMRFFKYPLGALSIITVFLVIFYFLTIRRGAVVSDRFMKAADSLIRKQDYLGLLAVCNRQNESISRVTAKTLDFATKNPTATFEEVREVTEAEGSRQVGFLRQRISYLSDIGAIAPMVGLLGTVFGMIGAFDKISQDQIAGVKQMGLASEISLALLTTAGGLVVGIPALMFYSIFRGRVQGLTAELEAATTHIMALLAAQYKRASSRAAAARVGARPAEAKPGVEQRRSAGT